MSQQAKKCGSTSPQISVRSQCGNTPSLPTSSTVGFAPQGPGETQMFPAMTSAPRDIPHTTGHLHPCGLSQGLQLSPDRPLLVTLSRQWLTSVWLEFPQKQEARFGPPTPFP